MPKFKIKWSETVIQYWEKIVEAETAEDAEQLYHDGNHIDGDEYVAEESFLESEFQDVEEIAESYECDDCHVSMTPEEYFQNKGLCDSCIDKIN